MGYRLVHPVLGSTAFTPLSEEEFYRLGRSINNLWVMLAIEELLDLVIANYLDLENDLLSMATRMMVLGTVEYEYLAAERNLIVNRRVLNLLNSCRGYLDHTCHHLSSGIQSHDPQRRSVYRDEFSRFTSEEYDAFFGYRVMEALRNSTQHARFPLAIMYGRGRADEDPARQLAYATIPLIEVGRLMLDKKFKASVLEELKSSGEKVELMPLVRQYVASLGNIHEKLRTLLRPCVEEWEHTLFALIERFRTQNPDEKFGTLCAVKLLDDGTGAWEETIEVYVLPIEYRRRLERKNRYLASLASRYVTSASGLNPFLGLPAQ